MMRSALGHDLLDLLRTRASVRSFSDEEVSEELVAEVLEQAMRAPSAFNFQPYSFLVVRDPALTAELAALAGGQPHVRNAPVTIVLCAEVDRVARHSGFDAGPGGEDLDLVLGCVVDASLAGMCASLAAEALGLGTVMIGGIRNDPPAVRALLGIPEGVVVPFAISLGWPERRPAARPRVDPALAVHRDRYDPALAELAARYDARTLRKPDGPVSEEEAEVWQRDLAKGAGRARKMHAKARAASS